MLRRFTLLTVLALVAASAYAQLATTTSLVGTVTDASGKTVAGAKVAAVNTGTRDTYSATTNEIGYYNFPFVAIGDYVISVEMAGFQISRVTGIRVDINQVVRNDVTLKVGNVIESVT